MNKGIIAVVGLAGMLVVGVAGCEKATPPSASGGNGGSGGGGPINKLAENPSSLPGKSVGMARDVAKKASSAEDAAVGAAQEISGEATALSVSGLSWSAPTAWEKTTPSSSMRAAEFKVKSASGGGEAVVAFFGNIQGDAASNIERWRTQFADGAGAPPEVTTKQQTIAGCKVWLASLKGTYKGGTMGGPAADMPNAALRGVIVEGPQGSVFIKFTGPEATILEHEAEWNTMVNGMRKQ